jgi:hypothetical protein
MDPAETHRAYFERRADEERAAAVRAVDARAAQSHLDLAACYDALASGGLEDIWIHRPQQSPGTLSAELRIIP